MSERDERPKQLPEHATRVFVGELFDVWQWKQKMYDGSMAVFERVRRQDTVDAVVVVEDGRVLVQSQVQPDREMPWICLPGGRVEWGEDPFDAIKREALEETGYTSDDWELWFTVPGEGKVMRANYFYIARNAVKAHEPHLDAGEKITVEAKTIDEFFALAHSDNFPEPYLRIELLKMETDSTAKEAFIARLRGIN